jgi:hypothetical protein
MRKFKETIKKELNSDKKYDSLIEVQAVLEYRYDF